MIEVDKILEQAGYFETRKESVEEILKMYMANGYDSNSKQIKCHITDTQQRENNDEILLIIS